MVGSDPSAEFMSISPKCVYRSIVRVMVGTSAARSNDAEVSLASSLARSPVIAATRYSIARAAPFSPRNVSWLFSVSAISPVRSLGKSARRSWRTSTRAFSRDKWANGFSGPRRSFTSQWPNDFTAPKQ